MYGSTADTLRAVVRAAEPIMYIVPEASPLIVRARVKKPKRPKNAIVEVPR